MPCFFCNSIFHPSHLCDIYVTDESRIAIAESKNCCPDCLSDEKKHTKKVGYKLYQPKCYDIKKCYECFSKDDHFAFYCPQRFSASPKLFVPKIDKDLLPRFMQMFDALEQYSIGFLYPDAEKAIKFKPLKIYLNTETTSNAIKSETSNIIALKELRLRDSGNYLKVFDAIKSKLLFINRTKKISIGHYEISANNLFLLLDSSNIESLEFSSAKVVPAVEISDVLQKTPNLLSFDLYDYMGSSIRIKPSWPDDFLQYTPNIKFVKLYIDDLDFEVKSLQDLLKPKNTNEPLRIELYYYSKKKVSGIVKRKFSGFAPKHNKMKPVLCITVRDRRHPVYGTNTVFNFSSL